jgi:DNA gyrase subunit A
MIGLGIGKMLNDVVDLIEKRVITDIVDISNMTSKEGIKIVFDLKKDADVEYIKNVLYKKTKLEDVFAVSNLVIVDGRPEILSLRDIIRHHVDFRFECETRKYTNLLAKEQDRKEVQEGLIKACDVIDLIIEILRGAKNVKDAKACLMLGNTANITFKKKTSEKEAAALHFTERQAQAILEMRLQKLIGLEVDALKAEHAQTLKNIAKYEDILKNRKSMMKVIIEDLEKIKKEYGRPRRTVIADIEDVVIEEKKVEEKDVILLMDRFGYTRTVDVTTYEKNKEAADAENKHIIPCKNIGKICLFTNTGKMHQVKVADLPHGNFRSKGVPIDNVSNFSSATEEMIWICAEGDLDNKKLLFSTKLGMMKQVDGSEFKVAKKTIAATSLNDGDELLSINVMEDRTMLVIQTKGGYFLKFLAEQVPEKKKGAVGVRGIKLQKDDCVEKVHVYRDGLETKIQYKDKELTLNRLKEAKRDGTGIKQK